jgi:NTE family protein
MIDLALQGGGSHGAFTWGVLDRILADRRLCIEAISGTSAGAMNAVVLADGMHTGGAEGARRALARFWQTIGRAARFSPLQRTPVDWLLGRWTLDASPGYWLFDSLTRSFSPYDLNPLNFNPLRSLLVEAINFDRVRASNEPKLFIAATNVRTGQAKVFRNRDLNADAVLASACLPFLFHAVEIDGEPYWDGGYMGNPVLFPLVEETATRDLVIVQINPIYRTRAPRRALEILNRINEITFNSSLIKELKSLVLLKSLVDEEGINRAIYREMRLHRIAAEGEMYSLGASSKLNAEWRFLRHLHDVGWRTAGRWLDQNYEMIGKQSTLDLSELLLTGHPAANDSASPRPVMG